MLLLFPRRGKHSRDAIDFLTIFTIDFLTIFTYDFINAETWAGTPALNPDFIIAKPPAKLIDNDIRNSINAFTFPP